MERWRRWRVRFGATRGAARRVSDGVIFLGDTPAAYTPPGELEWDARTSLTATLAGVAACVTGSGAPGARARTRAPAGVRLS